eukprot:TRINITY_DN7512_c0_g2_i1.p1 TRINITY_DN7512_c0_g2~~TRINITY_DN7512_c0_g2_i1.p1  ORF type:complete len:391 (+),score=81.57 TRINITY_DN7512_c0_g2_i1:69-1175(+)
MSSAATRRATAALASRIAGKPLARQLGIRGLQGQSRSPGSRNLTKLAAGQLSRLVRYVRWKASIQSVDVPDALPKTHKKERAEAPATLRETKIGFIGWGAMAQAVSLGIVRQGLTATENVMAVDLEPAILEAASREGLRTAKSPEEVVRWADVVVVAVKPQVVNATFLEGLSRDWDLDRKVLVSICAGITCDTYLQGLGDRAKIVRVMPNTPCLVAEAATAYAGSSNCTESDLDLVHGMFDAVGGATHRVPEYLLNAVTGLSGSGPAYVYMLIQAMSDAGVHGGLPRKVATSLAAQTVLGAAKMVQESNEHPAVLKEAVTSPAGTTIAGVRTLEKHGFNAAIIEAVEAARARSEALSKKDDFLFERKK